MITITPEEITFTSRNRVSNKTLSAKLVSGYECPVCKNIIQAIFLTDKEIDTYPFEEVNILRNEEEVDAGSFKEILPNDKHKKKVSCYKSNFDPKLGYQEIKLKNHIVNMSSANVSSDGKHMFETGPRPCTFMTLLSYSEDLLAKDLLFFSRMDMSELSKSKPLPGLDVVAPKSGESTVFQRMPGIGPVPDGILVRVMKLQYGYDYVFDNVLKEYYKG